MAEGEPKNTGEGPRFGASFLREGTTHDAVPLVENVVFATDEKAGTEWAEHISEVHGAPVAEDAYIIDAGQGVKEAVNLFQVHLKAQIQMLLNGNQQVLRLQANLD